MRCPTSCGGIHKGFVSLSRPRENKVALPMGGVFGVPYPRGTVTLFSGPLVTVVFTVYRGNFPVYARWIALFQSRTRSAVTPGPVYWIGRVIEKLLPDTESESQ